MADAASRPADDPLTRELEQLREQLAAGRERAETDVHELSVLRYDLLMIASGLQVIAERRDALLDEAKEKRLRDGRSRSGDEAGAAAG